MVLRRNEVKKEEVVGVKMEMSGQTEAKCVFHVVAIL